MKAGITVTGSGTASAPPDRCILTLGAAAAARTVAEAMFAVSQKAEAVLAALADRGVAGPAVRTTELTIWPEQDREGSPTGFRVRNIIRAEIADIARVGEVVGAATAAAGDLAEMQGINFQLTDTSTVEAEARRLAWEAARTKAEQLASLAGVRLGAPVAVIEGGGGSGGGLPMMKMVMAEAAPVEPGSTEVRVQVTVRFALAG